VTVARDDLRASVEVRDTGPGIAEEELPSIFDRYYRARDGHGSTAGTGLGLAITKRIVELHGGTIEVASSLGKGAAFRLSVPLGGEDPSTPRASAS